MIQSARLAVSNAGIEVDHVEVGGGAGQRRPLILGVHCLVVDRGIRRAALLREEARFDRLDEYLRTLA